MRRTAPPVAHLGALESSAWLKMRHPTSEECGCGYNTWESVLTYQSSAVPWQGWRTPVDSNGSARELRPYSGKPSSFRLFLTAVLPCLRIRGSTQQIMTMGFACSGERP